MPEYSWPPKEQRKLIGKRISRLDGPEKAAGRAKYGSDISRPGLLYGIILTCPHAHARIVSLDMTEAQKVKGVAAVEVISGPGTECQWAGTEVAAVAASSEDIARDALRKIRVEYEVLPHFVKDEDREAARASSRAKAAGEQATGDVDQAFKSADVTFEGYYGIPVLTHCCLEPHGQVLMWKGDRIDYWSSTQAVTDIRGDIATNLKIPATQVHVHQDHVGGGFGSKFAADRWGPVGARLSKASGGRPVHLFLDRATELTIAGCRPSAYANVKLAAKKDGTIIGWESESWASGGFAGGGSPPIPYVFSEIPNQKKNHIAISVNAQGARAWRAPNHQQACYLTQCAMEDLAAKLQMDPLELFMKNCDHTGRPAVYRAQFQRAAELINWKRNWHPRADSGPGHIKRGLGLACHMWGGAGHPSQCRANIHADGSVSVELGSQDLGTGTRTIIAQVAAESLGLPVQAVQVKIGESDYPPSGASGGSTTVGGVSSSTRKATLNALEKLFEVAAPGLGATPDQLEAVDSRIRVKGNAAKAITWQAACRKLGTRTISEMGENNPRRPGGLNTGGVGGVQVADVSVDIETGIVKVNKMVAVQDCGMVINPKTAESQCFGGMIMSAICGALYEERVMDPQTGRVLNPDMEFYKLAGIGDIGQLVVEFSMEEEHDKRGVVGLGEPPAIGGITAIANAVANAIGVRVTNVPLTPDRVLAALERRNA